MSREFINIQRLLHLTVQCRKKIKRATNTFCIYLDPNGINLSPTYKNKTLFNQFLQKYLLICNLVKVFGNLV